MVQYLLYRTSLTNDLYLLNHSRTRIVQYNADVTYSETETCIKEPRKRSNPAHLPNYIEEALTGGPVEISQEPFCIVAIFSLCVFQ